MDTFFFCQNTRIFTILMTTGIGGLMVILVMLTFVRGKPDQWKNYNLLPKGVFGASCNFIIYIYT